MRGEKGWEEALLRAAIQAMENHTVRGAPREDRTDGRTVRSLKNGPTEERLYSDSTADKET